MEHTLFLNDPMIGKGINMDFLKNIEKTLLFPFMDCFDHRPKERLLLEWNDGTRIYTRLDTAGESQNVFDEDEEGFEEYFACIMETVEIVSIGTAPVWDFEVGGLFEINYHNFPDFVRDSKGTILLEKSKLLAK